MKYHVVKATKTKGIASFIYMVNSMINSKRGWKVSGGITTDTHHYYQALIKEENHG